MNALRQVGVAVFCCTGVLVLLSLFAPVSARAMTRDALLLGRFCSPLDDAAQCRALVDFAAAAGHGTWELQYRPASNFPPVLVSTTGAAWLTPRSYCTWLGVTCGGPDGRDVTRLEFPNELRLSRGSLQPLTGLNRLTTLRFGSPDSASDMLPISKELAGSTDVLKSLPLLQSLSLISTPLTCPTDKRVPCCQAKFMPVNQNGQQSVVRTSGCNHLDRKGWMPDYARADAMDFYKAYVSPEELEAQQAAVRAAEQEHSDKKRESAAELQEAANKARLVAEAAQRAAAEAQQRASEAGSDI